MAARQNGQRHVSETGNAPETAGGAEDGAVGVTGPGAEGWPEIRRRSALLDDEDVLVIDKPADVSVVGERHDTDLMRMAKDAGEWLMPAHRIDKVTSGVVVLAKSLPVHADLARQFNRRTVGKAYLALVRNTGLPGQRPVLPERGEIELPLSVGRKSRVRVAAPRETITASAGRWHVAESDVLPKVRTYPSTTLFGTVWRDERHTLLVVRPVTGRRHQIRVHLAWIGHPIEGDPLFDRQNASGTPRTCLHSWRIAFDRGWGDGSRVTVSAPPGDAFWAPVRDRLEGTVEETTAHAERVLGRLEREARSAR